MKKGGKTKNFFPIIQKVKNISNLNVHIEK